MFAGPYKAFSTENPYNRYTPSSDLAERDVLPVSPLIRANRAGASNVWRRALTVDGLAYDLIHLPRKVAGVFLARSGFLATDLIHLPTSRQGSFPRQRKIEPGSVPSELQVTIGRNEGQWIG